jgi:DNA invertase Pin-like site-specific DNA recombinase
MALVGYARVSSVGQSLDVQLDKLGHCDKVFQEKKSGAAGKRPRLQDCLEYVREGDTLVVPLRPIGSFNPAFVTDRR